MSFAVPMLLYLSCASVLMAAGGIGLSVVLQSTHQRFSENALYDVAVAPIAPVALAAETEPAPAPETSSVNRAPAWIAPTPKYDLPTPQIAKRAIENAKKAAGDSARKAGIAKQRRERGQPGINDDALSAYGYAGQPRLFFHRWIQ